ncbi:hypothetical protein BDZ97DRAFT_1915737 [Flammula alnicola]|nr:hypothetical protein BDZ97DRAFT_1915737 [Flammula alnicola]
MSSVIAIRGYLLPPSLYNLFKPSLVIYPPFSIQTVSSHVFPRPRPITAFYLGDNAKLDFQRDGLSRIFKRHPFRRPNDVQFYDPSVIDYPVVLSSERGRDRSPLYRDRKGPAATTNTSERHEHSLESFENDARTVVGELSTNLEGQRRLGMLERWKDAVMRRRWKAV